MISGGRLEASIAVVRLPATPHGVALIYESALNATVRQMKKHENVKNLKIQRRISLLQAIFMRV